MRINIHAVSTEWRQRLKALYTASLKYSVAPSRVPLPLQGNAVVKAVFGTGKKRVAGCAVMEGKMTKAGYVTVKRGKQVRC